MVLCMCVIGVKTEFRYSELHAWFYMLFHKYMDICVYFVPLGSDFDHTMNVKVTTVHALIVLVASYTQDEVKDWSVL